MLSPRRQTALIALALFAGLGALAIHASPLSAGSLEARLQASAEAALERARASAWASVEMDGQVATVSGQAPSRTAREAAVAAVARSSWAGGAVAGGVARIVDDTRLAHEGETVRLAADLSSARLVLTGFAPDADAVQRVSERAERLFPGRADITLRIAPGSAAEDWDGAVRLMLAELARLDHGGGRVADGRIALTGLASNAQTLDAVRRAFAAPPQGYAAAALVRVDGGAFEGRVDDARLCEMLIDAALGPGGVAFTPGRAVLASGSENVLRRAGRVYRACAASPLSVAVRAESEDARAEALALERAEAIIAAMAQGEADRSRFRAESAPADAGSAFRLTLPAPARAAEDGAADSATDPATGSETEPGAEPAQTDEPTDAEEG